MNLRERYARLEELFAGLVDLPAEERTRRLARLTPEDQDLREELLELLGADEPQDRFLEPPEAAELDAVTPLPETSEPAGAGPFGGEELAADTRLGAYRIAKKLAEGGMGSVYLASRADREFEQLVAIKVLRRGLSSESARARLRLERQTLAGLSHPYVARLLDGGSTAEGHPYLVLEYIEGRPIDLSCEERRLSFRARIELLIRVCEAVSHAHRRLVVHRDLKPSNILVTEDGSPRLLDFGIAKLLSMSDSGSDPSIVAFTPAYASPEQKRGGTVGTATDIYSLGRLLERLVLPTVQGLGRRETAAVIARATAEEEEGRYPSVDHFIEELKRLGTGFPVEALGNTRGYALRRFLARHRLASALVGIAFAALLGTAAALAVANGRAQRDRQRAEAARSAAEVARAEAIRSEANARERAEEARRAARRHLAAQEFLRRLLRSPSAREHGPEVRMVDFLDDARQQLEVQPPEDALSEIAVRRSLGGAYAELGRYDDAILQFERSVELLRREVGEDEPQYVLAVTELGDALSFTEGHERGRELLERAAEEMRARPDDFTPEEHLTALHSLMRSHQHQRELLAGLAVAEEAIALIRAQKIPAPLASDTLVTASSLELNRDESSEQGLAWLHEGIALAAEKFGADHFLTQDYSLGLAYHLDGLGRFEEALRLLEPLVASRRARFPRNHPNLRLPLTHLGLTLRELGRYEEAIRVLREALLIQLEYGGEDHQDTGMFRNNLAVALRRSGQVEEAEKLLREVVASEERNFGRTSAEWALASNNLAVLLEGRGEFRQAQEILKASVEVLRAIDGDRSLRLGRCWMSLATTHIRLQEYEEAQRCYEKAVSIRRVLLPPGHPWTVDAVYSVGRSAALRGDRELAYQRFHESLEVLELGSDPPFEKRYRSAIDLAGICAETERWEEEREVLTELWSACEVGGASREQRVKVLEGLVGNAQRRGAGEEATKWGEELRMLGAGEGAGG